MHQIYFTHQIAEISTQSARKYWESAKRLIVGNVGQFTQTVDAVAQDYMASGFPSYSESKRGRVTLPEDENMKILARRKDADAKFKLALMRIRDKHNLSSLNEAATVWAEAVRRHRTNQNASRTMQAIHQAGQQPADAQQAAQNESECRERTNSQTSATNVSARSMQPQATQDAQAAQEDQAPRSNDAGDLSDVLAINKAQHEPHTTKKATLHAEQAQPLDEGITRITPEHQRLIDHTLSSYSPQEREIYSGKPITKASTPPPYKRRMGEIQQIFIPCAPHARMSSDEINLCMRAGGVYLATKNMQTSLTTPLPTMAAAATPAVTPPRTLSASSFMMSMAADLMEN
jgi:hypothetical protein